MSSQTEFGALEVLAPGDPTSSDGYRFTSINPVITAFLLQVGAVTHVHDAHAAMVDPTAALELEISSTGGALPAGQVIYVEYTLTDPNGGESLPAPLATVNTSPGYIDPTGAPTAVVDFAAGSLLGNTYLYAASVTDGLGGETALGPAASVLVNPSANAEATLTGLSAITNTASGDDPNGGWRLWRSVDGVSWALMSTGPNTTDSWVDEGTTAGDCSMAPRSAGTTGGHSSLSITVPGAGQPSTATFFTIYACTDGNFGSPCMLGVYPISDFDDAQVFETLTLQGGQPPLASLCLPGANQINPDTDILDWPWKRPVATPDDLPTEGNEDGDCRVILSIYAIAIWEAGSSSWQPAIGGSSGSSSSSLVIADENGDTSTATTELTFAGADGTTVVVSDDDGQPLVTITAPSGGGSPLEVTDGTTAVSDITQITFMGATVTDDGSGQATVTIEGGSGGSSGSSGSSGDVALVLVDSNDEVATVSAGTLEKVDITNVVSDSAGWWDATNLRYTPQEAGYYEVNVAFEGAVALEVGGLMDIAIGLNGATVGTPFLQRWVSTNADYGPSMSGSGVVQCDGSTDYIEIFAGCTDSMSGGFYVTMTKTGDGGNAGLDLAVESSKGTTDYGVVSQLLLEAGPNITLLGDDSGDTLTVTIGARSPTAVAVNEQAGDYTLGLFDAGIVVELTGTLTVPANADVDFPVGAFVEVCDVGSAGVQIIGAGGVTLDLPPTALAQSPGQWATMRLRQRATDEWVLSGDLAVTGGSGGSGGSGGGGASPGVFFSDTFTDIDGTTIVDHTPDLGGAYTPTGTGGGPSITGDQLAATGTGFVLSDTTPPTPDYKISCQFYGFSGGSSSNIGVWVRAAFTGGQTGYLMVMTSVGVYAQLFNNGAFTELAGPFSGTDGDTWELEADGTTITVYQNGTSVWTAEDSTITAAGTPGVSSGEDGAPVYLDNLTASTL